MSDEVLGGVGSTSATRLLLEVSEASELLDDCETSEYNELVS